MHDLDSASGSRPFGPVGVVVLRQQPRAHQNVAGWPPPLPGSPGRRRPTTAPPAPAPPASPPPSPGSGRSPAPPFPAPVRSRASVASACSASAPSTPRIRIVGRAGQELPLPVPLVPETRDREGQERQRSPLLLHRRDHLVHQRLVLETHTEPRRGLHQGPTQGRRRRAGPGASRLERQERAQGESS